MIKNSLYIVVGSLLCASALRAEESFSFKVDPVVLDYLFYDDADAASSKAEEYRDLYDGFGIPKLRLQGESPDGKRKLEVLAKNVGRSDAYYRMDYNVVDRYRLKVERNNIPHIFGRDGTLLYSATKDGVYEIADPTQAALQSALEAQFAENKSKINFVFLDRLLQPYLLTANKVDIQLNRERTKIQAQMASAKNLTFAAEVFHENRKGSRPYGASLGFNNISELPEPIDYDTTEVKLATQWQTKKSSVQFGVKHSSFVNHIDFLTWDNVWRITDSTDPSAYSSPGSGSIGGASQGRVALAPDNKASEIFANGQVALGGKSWMNGGLSYQVMEQKDRFLPYTINSVMNEAADVPFDATLLSSLPEDRLHGKVAVLNLVANAGTRLMDWLDFKVNLKHYDYNNKTNRIEFPGYARFDAVWEEIGRVNAPFSHSKTSGGAEASFKVAARTSLTAGVFLEHMSRELREVDGSDELGLRLSLNTRPVKKLSIRAILERTDRSIDAYRPEAQHETFLDPESVNNLPTLRKFDEAGRVANDYRVQAQYALSKTIGLSAGFRSRTEDYQDENGNASEFGLISDDWNRLNAELSLTPAEGLSFFLFADRLDRENFQRARQSGGTVSTNPADNWEATFAELNTTLGLGLGWQPEKSRWNAELSARKAKSDGDADFESPPGGSPDGAVDFDNYEDTDLFMLSADLGFKISKSAEIGLFYRYEDYSIDSFILQGLTPYLPGALLLAPNNGDYKLSLYATRLKLQF